MNGAGRQAARPHRGEHLVEARELLGRVGVVGLVGDGEMRAHAREPQLGAINDLRRELDRVLGAAPDAMHAGVDLQVHGERVVRVAIGDRLGQRVDTGERVHDGREPVRHHARRRFRNRLREHEDRRVDPGRRAARCPPRRARHPSRPRRASSAARADRRRSVPVAVGLDDREQLRRRAASRATRARWRAPLRDRSRPRPAGNRSSRRLAGARRHSLSPRDRVRCATPQAYGAGRARGRTQRCRARVPRRPRLVRGRTHRSRRPRTARHLARAAPPITPLSTSPVPAVASAGPPVRSITASTVGRRDDGARSLQQHDRRRVAARARARPRRGRRRRVGPRAVRTRPRGA